MIDLTFENLAPDATQKLLSDIASDIAPVNLPAGKTSVQVAALPFYDEYKLYAPLGYFAAGAQHALHPLEAGRRDRDELDQLADL